MSIKVARITSRGRFKNGSLTMDAAIECALTADNYSPINIKILNQFKKQVARNNNLFTKNSFELKSVKDHSQVYSSTTSCSLRLIAIAISREIGMDRISIKMENMTSRGRFNRGSMTMGKVIGCDFNADNYSTYKHKKVKNLFKKQVGNNNN